jgi:glycosyltransferase involved in cell wall biosynthesis
MGGLNGRPRAPLRVLYVLTTLDVGGAERSLLEVLRRIDRDRVEPIVCSLISGGDLRSSFRAMRIPVIDLGVRPGLAEIRGMQLLSLLVRWRPAIVHSRLILSNLWARLGVLVGARVICEERGLANERPQLVSSMNRATQRLCSMNVANSQAVAVRMRSRDRISANRLRVIYGGVDLGRFVPPSQGLPRAFDVVTTTRLENYKGVFDLIDAMELVLKRRPGTRLSIVGDGSQRVALQQAAAARGLSELVTFWGEQADVPSRLKEARVFVLSSHEEGLPNAAIEAMACALPVVATNVGGTPEVVADGETGRLVSPRDPQSLASAILYYLDHPQFMQAHGAAGRVRATARFDVEVTARAYEQLYVELVT